MRSAIAAVGAAAIALAFAASAHAQEVKLSYSDLDLSTPAGAATFSQRLDVAAKAWCTGGPVYSDSSKTRCMADARKMFLGSIPAARKTAYEAALKGDGRVQAAATPAAPAGS